MRNPYGTPLLTKITFLAMLTAIVTGTAFIACTTTDAVAPGRNLLRNASFEFECANASAPGGYHWTLGEPDDFGDCWGSASRFNWRAHDGLCVAAICGSWFKAGDKGGWWQDCPAKPGRHYRFTGWFYADAQWTAKQQRVMLEFRDASNTHVLQNISADLAGIGDAWTEKSLAGAAPAGTAYVRLVIFAEGAGPSGALQFDSFTLREDSP